MTTPTTYQIAVTEMQQKFYTILRNEGFTNEDARICAELFTTNSAEGVISHGVNRFPRFVRHVRKQFIKPQAKPRLTNAVGNIEQWDGQLGPGPLNALFATDRAMTLAENNGIGLVALANTNHWMRGGAYGLHSARKGFAFIGWTNTMANLVPWGSSEKKIGNNPIVLAIPHQDEPILLDMALSQYSYGKLKDYKANQQQLPYPGGYNQYDELTCSPDEILDGGRALPIGFWKGSAFSLLLDILASGLSAGLSTSGISKLGDEEYAVSQVFICIDLKKLGNFKFIEQNIQAILDDYLKAQPLTDGESVHYPGQHRKQILQKHLMTGVPVRKEIWDDICSL